MPAAADGDLTVSVKWHGTTACTGLLLICMQWRSRILDNGLSSMTRHNPLAVLHAMRTADPAAGGFVTYLASLRRGMAGGSVELRAESVFPRNDNWRVVALRRPFRFLGRVKRQLRHADVLHVHGVFGWHVLLSVWAARALGRPYAVTVHGHLHPDALRERRIAKRVYLALVGRRILEDASVVLVTAPPERSIVQRHAPRARIEEVMPGLQVPPSPECGDATLDDVPGRPLNLLYLGRLHPHKGLHRVVRALGQARAEGLQAELAVAGTGRRGYLLAVGRLVRKLGLEAHVRFLGHADGERKAMLWRAANVFVLPSRSENFGFAAAEAMAAGIPVIVSENVGLASLVEARQCGRVVPVGDTAALRQALLDYADPAFRRDQGRRAHAAARQAFSVRGMGAAHERIYRGIAAGNAVISNVTPNNGIAPGNRA